MIETLGSEEKLEDTLRDYYALYEGTGVSNEDIFEEVICDAAGNMNEFIMHGHMEDAAKAAPVLKAAKKAGKGARTEGGENTNATGRHSIDLTFADNLDAWLEETKDDPERRLRDGSRLRVGSTSESLAEAGVNNYDIYFSKSKIARILSDHSDITLDIIKEIPEILENPIIVMDSLTVPDSIVMFGDTKTESGKPVMVSMIINKRTKTGEILDYGVISGAYSRRINNVKSLIERSNVRYLNHNKERTGNWLKALRLQLPSASTPIGSNKFVPHWEDDVKDIIKELGDSGEYNSEAGGKMSRETDPEILKKLNSGKTMTVYRSMQLIDGKLYPPMAAKVKGKMVDTAEFGTWYVSDERPDAINRVDDRGIGWFTLDKANGDSLEAAYNPYWHTSNLMINDQFTSAYKRENLVTVECEIPVSELSSGYKAEYAKDPVGKTDWHKGPVAGKLAKTETPRTVYLSRWVKVNRIVDNAEVAKNIAGYLDGTNITVPVNTVTPGLRSELEKLGVPMSKVSGKVAEADKVRLNTSLEGGKHSRELGSYLQETHAEYKTDKENLRIAEQGVKDLLDGLERISAAGGKVDLGRPGREGKTDIRTLGNGISAQFIKTGRVNLNGTRIRNAEDLAQLCQIFRNPRFETVRYFYVKNGKIVGSDSVTCRLPGISTTYSEDFQRDDLIKKIKRVGADGVYLMHNHPSGNVTASRDDYNATGAIAETVQKNTDAKLLGHIIIDHRVFTELQADTRNRTVSSEEKEIPGQQDFDFLLMPSQEHRNLGKDVFSPETVAAVGRDIVSGKGYSAIVYANTKGQVRQIQEISDKALLNNKQMANYIRNQRVNVGAGMAFVYTQNDEVYKAMGTAYVNDILTDVILDRPEMLIDMRSGTRQHEGMYMGLSVSEKDAVHANEEQAEYKRGRKLDIVSVSGNNTSTEGGAENGETDPRRILRRGILGHGGTTEADSERARRWYSVLDFNGRKEGRRGVALSDYDNEGRQINGDNLSKLMGTVVTDSDGRPIAAYHSSGDLFSAFTKGDIGFHFGSLEQAHSRADEKNVSKQYYYRAYLKITKPIIILNDFWGWNAYQLVQELYRQNIISVDEAMAVFNMSSVDLREGKNAGGENNPYTWKSNEKLRELLSKKGYDGIIYDNDVEGSGASFIVFADDQIVKTEVYDRNGNVVEEYTDSAKASRELSTGALYEANRRLRSDLSKLRSQLKTRTAQKEYWKGQTKVTEGRQVRLDDAKKLARTIAKELDDIFYGAA